MKGRRELSTCFLFVQHLDADGCSCIRISPSGEIEAPLQKRTAEEIQPLQQSANTIVVAPTSSVSIHSLELPWLNDYKAREAIPYALEEKIAQPVSEVHFAFNKSYYSDGHYIILCIDKFLLSNWIGLLDELNIDFNDFTVDWFALNPGEIAIGPENTVFSLPDFKGSLTHQLSEIYLNKMKDVYHGYCFLNSELKIQSPLFTSSEELFEVFIAKRLLHKPIINLCQGEFKHNTHREANIRWYYAAGALFTLWLVSILGMNGIQLYQLNQEQTKIDQQIASIYHVFFPESTVVISPKFRVEQALKNVNEGKKGDLWYLLSPLIKAVENTDQVFIEQLTYQNEILAVTVRTKNFAPLEPFEKRLRQSNLQVNQVNASMNESKNVISNWEIRA